MFTLVEKTSIRNFLGWGAKYVQFDSGIERAFSFIEQLSASGDTSVEDLARALLVKIVAIEVEIDKTHSRFKADQVGPIKLNRREVSQLVQRGEAYIGQLARAIGVEVRAHALRADLPTTFATPWGPSGNGGGNEQMS
jgi:hypothetical protein